jgi:tetratricopeptide (TPR) repeat protein
MFRRSSSAEVKAMGSPLKFWIRSGLGLVIGLYFQAVPYALAYTQEEVQQLFEKAQKARARGDLMEAERKYLEVIYQAPQMANAYHNLGIVYFMQRKYPDAVTTLKKALKLTPSLSGAQVMLGLAYYELYDLDKASAAFDAALKSTPADTNALLYLGKTQLQRREYRAAQKTFEKLAELKPRDPEALYDLSLAHMKLMLENVNRLGEAAPGSYLFSLLLAQDAEARNDDETAIQKYREALALRGKEMVVGIHYALGSVYAKVGKYEEAAEEFKKELQINPNDSLALWKLGELGLRSDPQGVRGYLERAIILNPDLPQAALAYGRLLAKAGETEKAVEQFQRVIRLAPEEDSVHYHLAKAYRLLGRPEEAKIETARFEELAMKKSERKREMARQLIEMGRTIQEAEQEPDPGFSPSRDPTHQLK